MTLGAGIAEFGFGVSLRDGIFVGSGMLSAEFLFLEPSVPSSSSPKDKSPFAAFLFFFFGGWESNVGVRTLFFAH